MGVDSSVILTGRARWCFPPVQRGTRPSPSAGTDPRLRWPRPIPAAALPAEMSPEPGMWRFTVNISEQKRVREPKTTTVWEARWCPAGRSGDVWSDRTVQGFSEELEQSPSWLIVNRTRGTRGTGTVSSFLLSEEVFITMMALNSLIYVYGKKINLKKTLKKNLQIWKKKKKVC